MELHRLNHASCRSSLEVGLSLRSVFIIFAMKSLSGHVSSSSSEIENGSHFLVLMYVDDCTCADCQGFCIRDLFETVVEWPKAPNLLNEHPKPMMFIVKRNICWPIDMPVSSKYETDQLHSLVTRSLAKGVVNYVRGHRETICPSAVPI